MARSDACAETSLVCLRIVFAVGMAISIRITMIEMTISSSISVKPSSRATDDRVRAKPRLANFKIVQFISVLCLRCQTDAPAHTTKSYSLETQKGNETLGNPADAGFQFAVHC